MTWLTKSFFTVGTFPPCNRCRIALGWVPWRKWRLVGCALATPHVNCRNRRARRRGTRIVGARTLEVNVSRVASSNRWLLPLSPRKDATNPVPMRRLERWSLVSGTFLVLVPSWRISACRIVLFRTYRLKALFRGIGTLVVTRTLTARWRTTCRRTPRLIPWSGMDVIVLACRCRLHSAITCTGLNRLTVGPRIRRSTGGGRISVTLIAPCFRRRECRECVSLFPVVVLRCSLNVFITWIVLTLYVRKTLNQVRTDLCRLTPMSLIRRVLYNRDLRSIPRKSWRRTCVGSMVYWRRRRVVTSCLPLLAIIRTRRLTSWVVVVLLVPRRRGRPTFCALQIMTSRTYRLRMSRCMASAIGPTTWMSTLRWR